MGWLVKSGRSARREPSGRRTWQRAAEVCTDIGNLGTAGAGVLALGGAMTPTWLAGGTAVVGYLGAALCKWMSARR